MRAGKTYTCLKCGENSAHPVTCHRCDVMPVDENGNPPPPLFHREVLYRKPPDPAIDENQAGLPDVVAVGGFVFGSLARQVREMRRRRRFRVRFDTPISPIEAAEDGEAHVRGRVELLEATAHRLGGPVAAFLFRLREKTRGSDVAIETHVGCGKFLVRDESGVALVDDDFIAITPAQGEPFPASNNIDVRIRDGDLVEVVGMATRRSTTDVPGAGRGGFREAPKILVFDGTADQLVVIRPAATPEST